MMSARAFLASVHASAAKPRVAPSSPRCSGTPSSPCKMNASSGTVPHFHRHKALDGTAASQTYVKNQGGLIVSFRNLRAVSKRSVASSSRRRRRSAIHKCDHYGLVPERRSAVSWGPPLSAVPIPGILVEVSQDFPTTTASVTEHPVGRAYELAMAGDCLSVDDVELRLREEGFNTAITLGNRHFRDQLDTIIRARRAGRWPRRR